MSPDRDPYKAISVGFGVIICACAAAVLVALTYALVRWIVS